MIKKGLILACMIAVFSLCSFAQVHGKIEGIVTDSEKNPLEKVTIVIISTKTSATRFNISTNKQGKFAQIGIWPGYYQVNFKKAGYVPASYEVKISIA
ncbi:MAG: carboxypeptidase-like regulatory domain-containing protein, partial [Acidobacteriota bacterium]|nr:carboxypeptidase-like regulatory domain-containing protein [Acidobacteriota bacterium]